MNDLDSIKITERYILMELFENKYDILYIESNSGVRFSSVSEIIHHMYDLKRFDTFHAFFNNKNDDSIKISFLINPTNNKYIRYSLVFWAQNGKTMTKSNDATVVTGTVFSFLMEYLKSFKLLVETTTNDWDDKINYGLINFNALPNQTMNHVSKQIRTKKEDTNGISQRGRMYKMAFSKIIKPVLPELNLIDKGGNDFEIKS